MTQKPQKQNPPKISPRVSELLTCEKEMIKIFETHHVTLPEAVFIFEKIKFSSFYHSMFAGLSHRKDAALQSNEMMFR
jgi:hypothetical protein